MFEWLFSALQQLTSVDWHQVQFRHFEWFIGGMVVVMALLFLHLWRPASTDLEQGVASRFVRFRHSLMHLFVPKTAANASNQGGLKWLLYPLRVLVLLFALLALAQPEWIKPLKSQTSTQSSRDIQFVVESSVTFVLPDYELNGKPVERMQVVKAVLEDFIQQLKGNRFGLSIFAEQAYMLLPMTSDARAAQLSLQRLKPFLAGRTDEGMGEALGLALQQIDQEGTSPNRIVVLISDGLSRPSAMPLKSIVQYAQAMNVPIYTIGIGAGSAQADRRQYAGLNYAPLDPTVLKWLAQQTGGDYFRVSSGEALQQVLAEIRATAGKPVVLPPPPPQHIPLYFWPLKVAVALLLLYVALLSVHANRMARQGGQP